MNAGIAAITSVMGGTNRVVRLPITQRATKLRTPSAPNNQVSQGDGISAVPLATLTLRPKTVTG